HAGPREKISNEGRRRFPIMAVVAGDDEDFDFLFLIGGEAGEGQDQQGRGTAHEQASIHVGVLPGEKTISLTKSLRVSDSGGCAPSRAAPGMPRKNPACCTAGRARGNVPANGSRCEPDGAGTRRGRRRARAWRKTKRIVAPE